MTGPPLSQSWRGKHHEFRQLPMAAVAASASKPLQEHDERELLAVLATVPQARALLDQGFFYHSSEPAKGRLLFMRVSDVVSDA